MKVKTALFLFLIFVLAQTILSQNKVIKIECSLAVNETVWTKHARLTATLTLKNNSDQDIEINLPPRFILEIPSARTNRSGIIFGEQYTSKEKESDYIITKRTKNGFSYKIRQFFSFLLKSGESKTVEFNLTNLAWNDSMSSILVDIGWYNRIPTGDYNLYYKWGYDLDESDKSKGSLSIISNKVPVTLKSKK